MRFIFCMLVAFLVGCVSSPQPIREGWVALQEGRVSMAYPKKNYAGGKIIVEPKLEKVEFTYMGHPEPERWVVNLKHPPRTTMVPKGVRYYYPASSHIYITPLRDSSMWDFSKAYPGLTKSANELRILLSDQKRDYSPYISQKWSTDPSQMRPTLPQEPYLNAGLALRAHFRRVETASLQGVRFLCYMRQGSAGYGVTNSELTYNFQGLTKNGNYYVRALLSVRHPSLPESMDDPRSAFDETESAGIAEQAMVNALDETDFEPSLSELDEMLTSIRVR